MSLLYSILVDSKIRPVSSGSTSELLAPPEKIDPVNLRNGHHDRDEMEFDKKIVQRNREMNFKNEPGTVNPYTRKVPHDPYNLP